MCTIPSKSFLLFALSLLVTSGHLLRADTTTAQPPSWLNTAVTEKQCPLIPVNVPAGALQVSAQTLLKQITVTGRVLRIAGTSSPDHIVIRADVAADFVRILWNGKQLGRFGPIDRIVIHGNGGDDVLVVKSSVHLPVVLDGGAGDDCLQGGSGGDQLFGGDGDDVLIAGTGRPALKGGPGHNRILIPHGLGKLEFASSADSGVMRKLDRIYKLEPLSRDNDSARGEVPSPILVGSAIWVTSRSNAFSAGPTLPVRRLCLQSRRTPMSSGSAVCSGIRTQRSGSKTARLGGQKTGPSS